MQFLVKFIAFSLGALGCWALQHEVGFSAVAAAVSVGLAGSFLPSIRPLERAHLHGAIYTGAFAAMCSREHLPYWPHVLALSLIGTCVYFALKPRLQGFGGKLGFVALIASLLFVFSRRLL